jgi:hypothetical protein
VSGSLPLFVELCAGTAAVSLRLHDAERRPPVSRQGGKQNYAEATLRMLGLQPGQQAPRYVWAEPDASVRVLLASYARPELWPQAADVLAGWAHEPPRELWQALRAESAPQEATARELARYVLLEGWTLWGGLYRGPGASSTGTVGVTLPGLWKRLRTLHAALPGQVCADARDVPVQAGAVVYVDPPYQGTNGYAHDLPRADVVQLALRWAAAGSTVAIAEAEPLPELLAAGWYAQELTWARDTRCRGRTYSAQKREFITCNVRPRHPGRPTRPVLPVLADNRGRRVL